MKLQPSIFLVLLSFMLSGCFSSTPEKQRYQLPTSELMTLQHDLSQTVLVIQPVTLSEGLYQSGIVIQTDDISLHAARQHLWSSDLQQQITQGLQRRLQQRLPQQTVLLAAPSTRQLTSQSLAIRIDAFQGHYSGYALTESQWQLTEADQKTIVLASTSVKTALASDGYESLVIALGENLDKLADAIVQSLKKQ